MKNFAEHVASLKATRSDKDAEMRQVAQKSVDESRSMTDAEQQQFDDLTAEIKRLDADIARYSALAAQDEASAAPVTETEQRKSFNGVVTHVKHVEKLEPGIAFARAVKCLGLGAMQNRDAIEIAKSKYGHNESVVHATGMLLTKGSVDPATTTDASWVKPLIGNQAVADFVEYLRPQTILGRFGQGGIPSLRRVPFRVPLVGQTSGGSGYWVGEGKPKPLTAFDFERRELTPLKVANIAVATMESVRDSTPAADLIIRDQLAAALRERLDADFIDPSVSASSGVNPASILNGVSPVLGGSAGNTADDVIADVKAIFSEFIVANNAPTSGVWIMPATIALALSLMRNALGQPEFPGVGMNGGTFQGLPVIVSEYVPTTSSGSVVALVNAGDIYYADHGGIDVSVSREASVEMSDQPSDPATASTVYVSLWQRNMIGFLAEMGVNWLRRRSSAVAYLDDVNWGS